MIGLPTANDVLTFRFGNMPLIDTRSEWLTESDAFDAEIHIRFLPLWGALSTGDADIRMGTSLEVIACIVTLDQLPRNMFRGTARAPANDVAVLHTAQIVVAAGWDARLSTRHHCVFCYLPFKHSEALLAQDGSIRLYTRLRDQEGDADPLFQAGKHRETMARFGRFPHHNEVLGHVFMPEEVEFLKQSGSSFQPWRGLRALMAFRLFVDCLARCTRQHVDQRG